MIASCQEYLRFQVINTQEKPDHARPKLRWYYSKIYTCEYLIASNPLFAGFDYPIKKSTS